MAEWYPRIPSDERAKRRTYSAAKRAQIAAKNGGRCIYCASILTDDWQVEHVRPIARGGTDAPANVWPSCAACNQRKSDRSFKAWALELLREWQQRAGSLQLVDLQTKQRQVEEARQEAQRQVEEAQRQVDAVKRQAQRQVEEARQKARRAQMERNRLLQKLRALHRSWHTARDYVVIAGPIARAHHFHIQHKGS